MRQLMHSFEGLSVPESILDGVRHGDIAAFCLFRGKNVSSPAQVRELTSSILNAAEVGGQFPPIIGIDQEGGQLIAICEGATELPGNMARGATRSTSLAKQAGEVLGRELLAMGINLDFAPSLDINLSPTNPVIGSRSFGDDPQLVADLGVALIKGMQGVGVFATAKHFPGHGDTSTDSHLTLPVLPHSLDRLRQVELVPFRAAIDADVAAIMTAHILVSAVDGHNPATVSPAVLNMLRLELGYQGLTMSDAMDMQAVATLGKEHSVKAALQAGIDLVILGHLTDQLSLAASLRPLEDSAAVGRIRAAQAKIPHTLPPLDVVGCAEHQHVAQEIADRSITLVRDNNRLALRPAPEAKIAVITPYSENLTPADTSADTEIGLAPAIEKRHRNVQSIQFRRGSTSADIQDVVQVALAAEIVIVGTVNAYHDPVQAGLVKALQANGKAPIVVSLRTPYDLAEFPDIETYLCAYSVRDVAVEAVARVLFGEITATGTLPC